MLAGGMTRDDILKDYPYLESAESTRCWIRRAAGQSPVIAAE